MPEEYEYAPSSSSPPEPARLGLRPVATILWCLGGLLVAAAVVVASLTGIRVAEERLPGSRKTSGIAVDSRVSVSGSHASPLVLAIHQQDLREYFFRESSISGTGLEGIADGRVFEHRGTLGLRVLEVDSDLLRVEIEEGPRQGESLWMKAPETDEDP